ncbi:MAG: extracellular solute-binding protein [Comamonadaceae bacterium]|nr:extracellular solute-binding protein [Comamonadaceae bacterium]
MEAAFNKGEVAMMISGPWAWDNVRKSKIDFGVAPIPDVGGKPSQALRRRARLHDRRAQQEQGHRQGVHRATRC